MAKKTEEKKTAKVSPVVVEKGQPIDIEKCFPAALAALAQPLRFAVVRMIQRKGALVKDIIAKTNTEPTLMSHHLGILRDAKLVNAERRGKTVFYTINPKVVNEDGSFKLGRVTVKVA